MGLIRSEVRQHASRKSCWIIIENTVYDVTDFLDSHPGGSSIILKYGGRDATEAFVPIHPGDTLQKYLKPQQKLGLLDEFDVQDDVKSKVDTAVVQSKPRRIKLSSIVSISDFELAAAKIIPPKSLAYIQTGAEDNQTLNWNRASWKYIRFRPRVLRPVDSVDTSCTIFGSKFSVPFIICPAGGGKLANPLGEVLLTKAAGKHNVLHWISNVAGCTKEELAAARSVNQNLYWQVYPKLDLTISEEEIKTAITLGYKGFALTVDAIRPGKREYDIRVSMAEDDLQNKEDEEEEETDAHEAEPTAVKRYPVWSSFDWPKAVKWLRGLTDLPIAVKGIQCWEDSALCMQYGVNPWLSNHGGRQLEGAPSSVETLLEMRKHCPEVFDNCDVIVDGGVSRGADIVKALALGAKAVGLGRGFIYSLVFGEAGTSKAIRILQHEVETTMALLGVTKISELNPSFVETSGLVYRAETYKSRL